MPSISIVSTARFGAGREIMGRTTESAGNWSKICLYYIPAMLNKIIKTRIWIIAITMVTVSFISGPLTGKGSSSQLLRFYTPILMGIGLPFLYALLSRDMIPLEKIILAPIVGFISLTII